jgi:mannose-6-phosphate isomerase-like protein (cupin superfamily)
VLGPGDGLTLWTLGGKFTLKLDGARAEGRLAVLEALATRSAEPPLHVHHREDEAWYVLDGQMTFHVADAAHVAASGTFVYAPKGLPHTFTVDVEPTKVLLIASPAGFEGFARELGIPADDPARTTAPDLPSPDALAPIAERYGIEVVGPPWRIAHPEEA